MSEPKRLELRELRSPTLPEHYRPLVEALESMAAESPTLGRLAELLVDFVRETVSTFEELYATEAPKIGDRVDVLTRSFHALDDAVSARLGALERAISELNRRTGQTADPDVPVTVFGVPVVLAEGVDGARIRAELALLERGLSGEQVVDRFEELGLLRRKEA